MTHVNFKRKKKNLALTLSSTKPNGESKKRRKQKKKKRRKGSERRDIVEIESTQRDEDPHTHAVMPPPMPAPCRRDVMMLASCETHLVLQRLSVPVLQRLHQITSLKLKIFQRGTECVIYKKIKYIKRLEEGRELLCLRWRFGRQGFESLGRNSVSKRN